MYQTILTYDVIEWAYYWQVISMKKYAPSNHDISISKLKPITPIISNKDLIFITEFPRLIELYKSNFLSKKTTVVGYFSVGWGHYLDWLEKIIKVCPHIVINNYECWNKFGRRFGTTYIPNGVDLDIYKITKPINIRKPKVIWIGSTQFHRCKNYHTILLPLKQKLINHGIDCEFISTTEQGRVFTRQQLCEWLLLHYHNLRPPHPLHYILFLLINDAFRQYVRHQYTYLWLVYKILDNLVLQYYFRHNYVCS